ncbi:MAG: hypothetical protein R3C32_09765 [Chloroflexota bacterium]
MGDVPVLVLLFGAGTYVVGMGLKGTSTSSSTSWPSCVPPPGRTVVWHRHTWASSRPTARRSTSRWAAAPCWRTQHAWRRPRAACRSTSWAARPRTCRAARSLRRPAGVPGRGARHGAARADADLEYRDGVLAGTLTNRSEDALESVAVTWAGQATVVPTLAPGQTADVGSTSAVAPCGPTGSPRWSSRRAARGRSSSSSGGPSSMSVSGYRSTLGTAGLQANPVIIAFRPGPTLDVTTGATASGGRHAVSAAGAIRVGGTLIVTDPAGGAEHPRDACQRRLGGRRLWSWGRAGSPAELRPMLALDDVRPTYYRARHLPGPGAACSPARASTWHRCRPQPSPTRTTP